MLNPSSFIKKLSVFLIIYLTAYLISPSASAQVFNSSVSAATGGTGRGAVEGGDATFLNPATLVHFRGRHLFGSVGSSDFAASLSDNTTESTIPAAFSYLQEKHDVAGDSLRLHDFVLTFAEFIAEKVTLGVNAHYYDEKLVNSQKSYLEINGDVGLEYTPTDYLGLGVVAYNFTGERTNVPADIRQSSTFGGGVNYIYHKIMRLRLDLTSQSTAMAGVESFMNQWLILRGGYSNQWETGRELITFGLGFEGPKFAINYAYQGNPRISGDYRHSIDLQFPF